MWTPKRIVLLIAWFAFFIAAYAGSSYFLGGIDGLPPLPDRFKPVIGLDSNNVVYPRQLEFSADKKLRLAFGEGADEVKKRTFKLEIEPRGMVVASQDVTIEQDGRARLAPFAVAIFSKDKGDGHYPEITTIQATEAYLSFDRRLNNITEMGNRKIIGGEMRGNIRINDNRATPERTDDVTLSTPGPLYYDEARHQIWTKESVKILDFRSKPQPTTIDGTGADLYLTAEQPKGAAPSAKNKNESASGVERVELRSDVTMHLWVDSKSGLLGPPREDTKTVKNAAKPPPPANAAAVEKPEENSHVVIMTQGPFSYDFNADKAVFEISKLAGLWSNLVCVDRSNEQTKMSDQLKCDRLEIQFARKGPVQGAVAQATPTSATDKLEIDTVRATGKSVVLTSDAEVLEAHGNEFTYNSKTLVSVLKGQPFMDALKEGNEIRAPELHMVNEKGKQQAYAIGEGTMNFWGNADSKKPQEARWKKKLTYTKEGDKDQLMLFGDAVFLDPEHEQVLKGETLKFF